MRISKTAAEQVAKVTLRNKKIEIESLTIAISKKLTALCLASLPDGIENMYTKYPKYLKTCNSVRIQADNLKISGEWTLHIYDESGRRDYLCLPSQSSYSFPLKKVSKKDADQINKWIDKLHFLQPEYTKLLSDLSTAIFNLRTYAKISENIPEVVPHLPKVAANTMLQVDLTKLRNRINQKP